MPMDFNFTHFAKYSDIEVAGIDLYEDAWGLNTEFSDVFKFLDQQDVTALNDYTDSQDFKDCTDIRTLPTLQILMILGSSGTFNPDL